MPESDTFTGDTSEAYPIQSSPSTAPSSSRTSQTKMPELNLENAYKTIQFFQDEPQWLANPRTTHAANAIFGQASRIVGMGIQIDRVNAQTEAARLRLSTDTRLINHLNEGMAKLQDMKSVAEIRDEINVNGPSPRAISLLNTALDAQNKVLEPQPTSMTLDDGTEVQGWLDPKTRKFTQYKPGTDVGAEGRKPTAATLTFSNGRSVDVVYGPSGAPTVIKDGKPADDAHQKALQKVAESDLLDARKAVHKASSVDEKEMALKAYDSAKRNFDSVFRPPPVVAPVTNGPTNPTPVTAPSGLTEGQRVRNRVTGKMGTVKNGVVIPDPEPAE